MANLKRKVVLVGTGMVGMSFAYAALNQSVCDELVLVDLNEVRARGEAWRSPTPACRSTLAATPTAPMRTSL